MIDILATNVLGGQASFGIEMLLAVSILSAIVIYSAYVIYKTELNEYIEVKAMKVWTFGTLAAVIALYGSMPTKNILVLSLITLSMITDIKQTDIPDIIPMFIFAIALSYPMDIVSLIICTGVAIFLLPICMIGRIGGGDFKILLAINFAMGWGFLMTSLVILAVVVILTGLLPMKIKNQEVEGIALKEPITKTKEEVRKTKKGWKPPTKGVPLMGYYGFSVLLIMLSGKFN